jgi:hypothetical protein
MESEHIAAFYQILIKNFYTFFACSGRKLFDCKPILTNFMELSPSSAAASCAAIQEQANPTYLNFNSYTQCKSVNNANISIIPPLRDMFRPQTATIRCFSYAKTVPLYRMFAYSHHI